MSLDDQVQSILGKIPALYATSFLQMRLLTSGPGIMPLTFGAWTPVVGHFQERSRGQPEDQNRKTHIRTRVAYLAVASSVVINDGSQISRSNVFTPAGTVLEIWDVSGKGEPHSVMPGMIRFSLTRNEPLYTGAARDGGL